MPACRGVVRLLRGAGVWAALFARNPRSGGLFLGFRGGKRLEPRQDLCFNRRAALRPASAAVAFSGGGGKPQEIDGEDGENPSLCRNRVGSFGSPSRNASPRCQPQWRQRSTASYPASIPDERQNHGTRDGCDSCCACPCVGRQLCLCAGFRPRGGARRLFIHLSSNPDVRRSSGKRRRGRRSGSGGSGGNNAGRFRRPECRSLRGHHTRWYCGRRRRRHGSPAGDGFGARRRGRAL